MTVKNAFLEMGATARIDRSEPNHFYNPRNMIQAEAFSNLKQTFPLTVPANHAGGSALSMAFAPLPLPDYEPAYIRTLRAGERDDTLPDIWQGFVNELQSSSDYQNLLKSFLNVENFRMRFEWHAATGGASCAPFIDAEHVAGKHIFYFNDDEDWRETWGGQTLILESKMGDGPQPELINFRRVIVTEMLNNRSLLFRRSPEAWQGFRTLSCPPEQQLKLFSVIFEHLL